MNTTAIATIAAELAKLTPQEHLIASELAQKLRCGDKPMPVVETPKRASQKGKPWSDDDTLLLMEFREDSTIMSKSERRRKVVQLCKHLGRNEKSITWKLYDISRKDAK